MKYEIKGGELPVVVCFMDAGETMITEKGSMSWMSPNMKMETTSNGGVGKALGRMFAGEAIFQNRYTAEGGPGMIAFASSFPGQIRRICHRVCTPAGTTDRSRYRLPCRYGGDMQYGDSHSARNQKHDVRRRRSV